PHDLDALVPGIGPIRVALVQRGGNLGVHVMHLIGAEPLADHADVAFVVALALCAQFLPFARRLSLRCATVAIAQMVEGAGIGPRLLRLVAFPELQRLASCDRSVRAERDARKAEPARCLTRVPMPRAVTFLAEERHRDFPHDPLPCPAFAFL